MTKIVLNHNKSAYNLKRFISLYKYSRIFASKCVYKQYATFLLLVRFHEIFLQNVFIILAKVFAQFSIGKGSIFGTKFGIGKSVNMNPDQNAGNLPRTNAEERT